MSDLGHYGQTEKPRHKNLKQLALDGTPPVGVWVTIPSPYIIEYAALAGFDFVSLDLEHHLYSVETVCDLIRTADACGLAAIARIADKAKILPLLDFGLAGVAIPHVRSAAQARELVEITKYRPVGRRGFNNAGRAHNYGQMPFAEYAKQAADEVTLAVQIEDLEGLENVEEIMAVPGIDYLWLGPGDLAMDMGHPNDDKHPEVLKALKRITDAADKNGVTYLGTGAPIAIVDDKTYLIRAFTEARATVYEKAKASYESDRKRYAEAGLI
jgi:4-hydroxy-2-oxoheptanedioate aldolase